MSTLTSTFADERQVSWDAAPTSRDWAGFAPEGCYPWLKGGIDFLLGLVLFVLHLPLMLFLAFLVKITSRGPAIYSQTRLGLDGRLYQMHKFRTMYDNCEQDSGPQWSPVEDPRVTPLGRFLRRTHLDELPQLWNVLCGEMSLIGPRPERPELVPDIEQGIPYYRQRLSVKPGVTGLAQVQLPADTDLESVQRKLQYDFYYIRNMSFGLDLRIHFGTVCKVCIIPFSIIRFLIGVPRLESLDLFGRPKAD
jgi:lipopolysaccharide/colanic/teichoic acid biosynthesis glycosyltransferase